MIRSSRLYREALPVELKPRKDRDGRREAILDVATEVFLEVGYSCASMSTIAARVGGSKGTLYNYFKSKEELFAAYVERYCARYQEVMDELIVNAPDVRAGLKGIGRTLLTVATTGVGLRNFTVIVSESGRAPDIGRNFYEMGPLHGIAQLAGFIGRAQADGRLRPCDPVLAAHQFVGMCQNRLLKARLCGYGREPTAAEIEAEVEAAVDTFMAAFGPRAPAGTSD